MLYIFNKILNKFTKCFNFFIKILLITIKLKYFFLNVIKFKVYILLLFV